MPTDSPLNGHPVYSRSTHIFLVSWLFSKFPQSSLEHPDVNCSRIRCVLTSLHWQALGSSQLSVGNQDLLIFSCKMLRDCHIQGMLRFEWGNNNLTMKKCLAFFNKKVESIAFAANYYEYCHSLLQSLSISRIPMIIHRRQAQWCFLRIAGFSLSRALAMANAACVGYCYTWCNRRTQLKN